MNVQVPPLGKPQMEHGARCAGWARQLFWEGTKSNLSTRFNTFQGIGQPL